MNTALAPLLTALTDAIAESPALAGDLYRRWQRRTVGPDEDVLAPDIADAAEMADAMLPRFTQQLELADAKALFAGAGAEPIFIWCAANPDRSDARMAPLLEAAVTRREYSEQVRNLVSFVKRRDQRYLVMVRSEQQKRSEREAKSRQHLTAVHHVKSCLVDKRH